MAYLVRIPDDDSDYVHEIARALDDDTLARTRQVATHGRDVFQVEAYIAGMDDIILMITGALPSELRN